MLLRALDKWLSKDETEILGWGAAVCPRRASTTHSASPTRAMLQTVTVRLALWWLFVKGLCEKGLPILEVRSPEYIDLGDSESQDEQRQVWDRVPWPLHAPPTSVALRDSAVGSSGAYG